jgi:hypothetical protein
MAYITTYIGDKVRPYSLYITIAWLVLIFFSAGIIYYFVYFKNSKYNFIDKHSKFTDVANEQVGESGTNKQVTYLYICTVDWCPHCIKAESTFQSFKNKYHNITIGNNTFYIQIKDLTNVNIKTPTTPDDNFAVKWNITQYPTVFIVDNKTQKQYIFKAKATLPNLEKFINSYTN